MSLSCYPSKFLKILDSVSLVAENLRIYLPTHEKKNLLLLGVTFPIGRVMAGDVCSPETRND